MPPSYKVAAAPYLVVRTWLPLAIATKRRRIACEADADWLCSSELSSTVQ